MLKISMVVLLAGFLLASACSPSSADQELAGTSWVLVSVNGNAPADGQTVTLEFSSDNAVGGFGGCNSFGGTYSENSSTGTITFSNLVSTLIACVDGSINEIETAVFVALNAANHYVLSGDTLTITADGQTLILERAS